MTLDDRGARAANALRRDLNRVAVPAPPNLDDLPTHHRLAVAALAVFVSVMLVAVPLVVRDRSRTDGQFGSSVGEPIPTDPAAPPISATGVEPPVELLVTPPNGVPYAVYVDDPTVVTQTFDLYFPGSTVLAFIADAPTDEAVGWLCSLGPCDPRETDTTASGHTRTWWAAAERADNETIVSVQGAGWTFVAQGPVRDLERFTSTLTIISGPELSMTAEGPLQFSTDGLADGLGRLSFETDGPEPAVFDIVANCRLDDTYTCFGQIGARTIQGGAPATYLHQP